MVQSFIQLSAAFLLAHIVPTKGVSFGMLEQDPHA